MSAHVRGRGIMNTHATPAQSMAGTLRRLIVSAPAPWLLDATLQAIGAQLHGAGRDTLLQLWAGLVRAVSALANSSTSSELEPVGAVAELIVTAAELLPSEPATIVRRTVRAAAALIVLVSEDTADAPALRQVLAGPGDARRGRGLPRVPARC